MEVENSVVLPFLDGDFVVPRWWANLPSFRRGPEHGADAPALPFTLEEARAIVNRELEQGIVKRTMDDFVAANRVRW